MEWIWCSVMGANGDIATFSALYCAMLQVCLFCYAFNVVQYCKYGCTPAELGFAAEYLIVKMSCNAKGKSFSGRDLSICCSRLPIWWETG